MSSLRHLVAHLDKLGTPMKRTKSGYMVRTPDGNLVAIHLTESDHRAVANTIARLKRHGLTVRMEKS